MNRLYEKNASIELMIIIILAIIGLYYEFERIIFLTAVFIFLFECFYSKYRNKDILINKNFELVKIFIYIYFIIIVIRYFLDPMLFYEGSFSIERNDSYIFNRLGMIFSLYGVILLYKNSHKREYKKFSFFKDELVNNKLIYISLFLNFIYIIGNFYNRILFKIISVIIHFIIIKNINSSYFPFLLIILSTISFLSGNYISISLMFMCYLNFKQNNKKEPKDEITEIMKRDVRI